MSESQVRVGGGCGAGRPIIGNQQPSRMTYRPETEEEQRERREHWLKLREASLAEEVARRERELEESKAMEAWQAKASQMEKDGPVIGSTVEAAVAVPATIFCEMMDGRRRAWVLIRFLAEYPVEPRFYLGSSGRFGLRGFLTKKDVDRLLTDENRDELRVTGRAFINSTVRKVRVLGWSHTRKSVAVELVD